MLTFAISTIGCKLNQYETDQITGRLIDSGLRKVDYGQPCDICIINTCSVTKNADRKCAQLVKKTSLKKPKPIIAVIGCGASNPDTKIGDLNPDLLIKNEQKDQASEMILNKLGIGISKGRYYSSKTRAFIKIQDGCNQFCTYCIVAHLRGVPKSRFEAEIISEVKSAIKMGYKELVLTGANISLYKDQKINLSRLIDKIISLEGDFRIRLSSLEIKGLTKELLSLAASPKFCKHFHLPLQSGSDTVLKRMNRDYTSSDFLSAAFAAREFLGEDVALTSDVIVGFAGETEEDFTQSQVIVKKAGLSKLHVFKYSPRKGTKAYDFNNQIKELIKRKRAQKLIALARVLRDNFIKQQLGKNHRILGEKFTDGKIEGLTDNYLKVRFDGNKDLINQFIEVELTKEDYGLYIR